MIKTTDQTFCLFNFKLLINMNNLIYVRVLSIARTALVSFNIKLSDVMPNLESINCSENILQNLDFLLDL